MRLFSAVLIVVTTMACQRGAGPTDAPAQAAGPAAAPGAAPAATAPNAAHAPEAVSGKVLERIDAPPYSYVRLASAAGEVWAAVPQTNAAVGDELTLASAMPMRDFESKSLKRKFDLVYFGTLAGQGTQAPAAAAPSGAHAAAPMPAAKPAAAAATEVAKVERASGANARSVEEVWTQRDALSGKDVEVRAQVVKFTAGVMGKNWLHVRDGSGGAEGGNNDLTITTADVAKVGDVVLAKGKVAINKDFGAGYKYAVIVEDAKLSQ